MKSKPLTPSAVKSNPDRFKPDHPCTIRAPLGEWIGPMAYPLVLLGLKNDLITGPITDRDRWNAQGLEGAGELCTTWARAFVLCTKAADNRCTIYPH